MKFINDGCTKEEIDELLYVIRQEKYNAMLIALLLATYREMISDEKPAN